MDAHDPRHGTYAGANQHWMEKSPLCDPCALAASRYVKRRKADAYATGSGRRVPSYRARRRKEALQALGWTMPAIAEETGMTRYSLYQLGNKGAVLIDRFERLDAAYRSLQMRTPPPGPYTNRTRFIAARLGYVPPLAWDDIDDPNEQPTGWEYVPASRAEAFADLSAKRVGLTEACRVLKVSRETLEKWCERNGKSSAYSAMLARETPVFEYANQHTKKGVA